MDKISINKGNVHCILNFKTYIFVFCQRFFNEGYH